ncbi:hypothetical protein FB451DRAFT_1373100 [Mycena latifolia]|nr:hypothetical protein FB451DRAFT_1373100 [Mycena latifolia]
MQHSPPPPRLFLPASMADTLCSGILYLCSCCCCCSSADPGSDGSGFCSSTRKDKKNRDPREKALKQEFMERGYRKDSVSGRIHVEQPSKSQLMMAAQQPSAELLKTPSVKRDGKEPTPGLLDVHSGISDPP